jgi:hypothetical protein
MINKPTMLEHELWREETATGIEHTFCRAGPKGDTARATLGEHAELIWTVFASSYSRAMEKYYNFMDWGEYTVIHEADRTPYSSEDE